MIPWTLDQLEVLEAIERAGSFSAAARALHRATSAVSYQVKALEDALGVALFDRSGHRAVLTAHGRVVLEEAHGVLAASRRLSERTRQLREGWEPRLQVVVEGITPQAPVMRALRRFGELGLPTRLSMGVEYLSGVAERFEAEGADLMILLDPGAEARLTTLPLPPVEMRLLARPDHPLHAGGEPLTRRALAAWVEVTVADSGSAPGPKPHRLFLGGPHVLEVSDFHAKREALLEGVGFGWLPGHLAAGPLEAGGLAEVPFEEGSRLTLQPFLAHRRDAEPGRGARRFMALLFDEVARQQAPPGEQAR